MACQGWNEMLVARLYDELSGPDSRKLDDHLAGCVGCRRELETLAESRAWLATARPEIPSAPRIVVLRSRQPAQSWMGFAAGFAAAALLLVAGLAGGWAWAERARPAASGTDLVARGERPAGPSLTATPVEYVTPAQFRELEQRLDRNDGRLEQIRSAIPARVMTPEEFRTQLAAFRQDHELRRDAEMQMLLQEIAGVEVRTGARIGQTQDVLEDLVVLTSSDRDRVPH